MEVLRPASGRLLHLVCWLCVAGCGSTVFDLEDIEQDDVPNQVDGQRWAMGSCPSNGDYLPTLYLRQHGNGVRHENHLLSV